MPTILTTPLSRPAAIVAASIVATLAVSAQLASGADESGFQTKLPAPLTDQQFLAQGQPDKEQVELGRALFFDPILSGNRNISCGTCHDPSRGLGDGLALGLGEGAFGMGASRRNRNGIISRVPRNAQALYNIGAIEYRSMFHDGRLEPDADSNFRSGYWSPAREHLPDGLDSLLAAQAMFPVLSPIEMAGHKGENLVATAVAEERLAGPNGAWQILANRLRQNPVYFAWFQRAFDEIDTPDDLSFVHAANALAAFQTLAFRSDKSPFDEVLRSGNASGISVQARRGMALFYGQAGCSSCHTGALQTDHQFHAIAMPQTGPGKQHGQDTGYWRASGFGDRLEDEGRYRVTFNEADLFAFRTPSLRNVALTGPWGHSGAYTSLEAVVRHHIAPVKALKQFDSSGVVHTLPPLGPVIEQTGKGSALIFRLVNPSRLDDWRARDTWVQSTPALRERIAEANDLAAVELSDRQIKDLVAFLHTLTDPTARDRSYLIPSTVPSALKPQPSPVAH